MLHSMLLSVVCPEFHTFPHYLIEGTIFGKRFIQHKICVLSSSANTGCRIYNIYNIYNIFIIFIIKVHTASGKLIFILVIFYET